MNTDSSFREVNINDDVLINVHPELIHMYSYGL